jgi:hypothetical protein
MVDDSYSKKQNEAKRTTFSYNEKWKIAGLSFYVFFVVLVVCVSSNGISATSFFTVDEFPGRSCHREVTCLVPHPLGTDRCTLLLPEFPLVLVHHPGLVETGMEDPPTAKSWRLTSLCETSTEAMLAAALDIH